MVKEILFIDFENIQTYDFKHLVGANTHVILFVGSKQVNINIDTLVDLMSGLAFDVVKIRTRTKNALDFSLSIEVGRFHEIEDLTTEFKIISNDKGFEAVASYITNHGRKIQLISNKNIDKNSKQDVKKPVYKVPEFEESVLKELEENEVDEVEEFSKYKTLADKVIHHFDTSKISKATKVKTLSNQIRSILKADKVKHSDTFKIIEYLKNIGYLSIYNTKVIYTN